MYIELDDARIHFRRMGYGKPLLWLHGFLGAGSDWRYQFPALPPGFELIVPDQRGHGNSTGLSGQFLFRQSARDMLALMSRIGIDRTYGIGVSGGGITLLHMACLEPSRIEAAVLVSVPPYFSDQSRAFQRAFTPDLLPPQELALMKKRHVHGEEQIDRLFARARGFADDHEDVRFSSAMLNRVRARTLLVFGDRDPLYPVSLAAELYAGLPNAALWVLPNAGHAPVFAEHAERFVDEALGFLGWNGGDDGRDRAKGGLP